MAAAKNVPPQLTRLCGTLRGLNANGRLAVCCFWLRHFHGAATRYLPNYLAGSGQSTWDASQTVNGS